MEHVDWVCEECAEVFCRPVGVRGRPRLYCSRRCQRKAGRLRAAARLIDLDGCMPATAADFTRWDGQGLEAWTPDDAA